MIPGPLMSAIFESLGWVSVVLDIAGLVICIRYLRLSTAMPLLVLAFAGSSGAGFISRILYHAIRFGVIPETMRTGIAVVTYVIHVAGTAAFVVGLWLVFRDIRERFQFLREVHESARESATAGPSSNL